MAYELTYHFKESIAPGKYAEEVKTMTKKIGGLDDETPIETVAGKIMAQLARRNIMVVDVEIYEFTKKKLSYRETEDGIVIKNKKFRFDDGPVAVETVTAAPTDPDYSEYDEPEAYVTPQLPAPQKQTLPATPAPRRRGKPMHVCIYEPLGVPANYMTPGKMYPIWNEEQVLPPGMNNIDPKLTPEERIAHLRRINSMAKTMYEVENDRGQSVKIAPENFSAPTAGLRIENEVIDKHQDTGPKLLGNFIEEPMPDFRSMRR